MTIINDIVNFVIVIYITLYDDALLLNNTANERSALMENINNCIQEVWHQEQDILNVFHDICLKHSLKYSLMFGTLLGAVRHGGFIPWDDDIDVIMPRKDYEKLLSIWESEAPKGYLIQNKRTNSDFTQNFSKIRKDHTTFIQDEVEKTKSYHTGIFIDIFPADRVAPLGINRHLQYIASALNLLCAREFRSGTKGMIGLVESLVLLLPHKARVKVFHKSEKFISKWQNNSVAEWYSPNTINECKRYFDSDIFDNLDSIAFCQERYCCVKDYDKILKQIYGDYMKLPPEKDRVWKHHPMIVNFECNYNELLTQESK